MSQRYAAPPSLPSSPHLNTSNEPPRQPRVRLSSNTNTTTSLRDRSALLGTSSHHSGGALTPPGSGRSTPFGYYNNDPSSSYAGGGGGNGVYGGPSGHRYADDLEGQNDEALEGLSAKVKLLKDVRFGFPPFQLKTYIGGAFGFG